MSVLVEEVQQAKSGKSLRVKLSGTWYGAKLDSGLNGAKGQMIEAEIQVSDKFGPWINKWVLTNATNAAPQVSSASPNQFSGVIAPMPSASAPAVAAAPAIPQEPERRYAEPAPVSTVAPWWMPFASNTVAHAIAAGLIKEPQDIRAWLIAAKTAATAHDDTPPF